MAQRCDLDLHAHGLGRSAASAVLFVASGASDPPGLQALLFAPLSEAQEPWTSKKALPLPIADCANSCAAYGTFYYQYEGYAPATDHAGRLLKYSTTADTWATGNAFLSQILPAWLAVLVGSFRIGPTPRHAPRVER